MNKMITISHSRVRMLENLFRSFSSRSLSFTSAIVMALFLAGCVAGEGGKSSAGCEDGETYDSVSRTCQGAAFEVEAPNPTLETISMVEDGGTKSIELTYTDNENDKVTSCSVSAATSSGLVRQVENQGILYRGKSDIADSHNTKIMIVSGSSLSVTTDTSLEDTRGIVITVTSSTTTLAVVGAVNANATASQWVSASALELGTLDPTDEAFSVSDVSCSCVGGQCYVSLTPSDNWYGTTEFTYTLTDNDGESDYQTVKVNVSSVNDEPSIVSVPGSALTVDGNGDTFYESYGSVTDTDSITMNEGELSDLVTLEDEADGDVNGDLLTYKLVSDVSHGYLTLSATGHYTYYTFEEVTSDSFQFKVEDPDGGESDAETITFTIVPVNDPPLATLTSVSSVDEDSTGVTYTLTYTDEEAADATTCEITDLNKVYSVGGCSCAATVCTATIVPLPNQRGSASFSYHIDDADSGNQASDEETVSFTINSVSDDPIAFSTASGTTLNFDESDTYVADTYSFTLDGAIDNDGSSVSDYEIVSSPSYGTLSGCLGIDGDDGLDCEYTPIDGNISDSVSTPYDFSTPTSNPGTTDLSSVDATTTGTFYRTALGDAYDDIDIQFVNISSGTEDISTLLGSNALAYMVDPTNVLILYESGVTTGTDIASAVSSNDDVAKFMTFVANASTTHSTDETVTLPGSGVATMDSFTFSAGSTVQTVHISVNPVEDRPTICEYSTYADTTVCGLNGCVGDFVPSTYTPDEDGLVFYSLETGACYVSNDGEWEAVESYMSNRSVNELDPIVIDNIRIDEGGGTYEDTDSVTITEINSSDENLVPLGNIEIYNLGTNTLLGTGDSGSISLGDGTSSADLTELRFRITPQTIDTSDDEKESEIEITVSDGAFTTEVVFTVTVLKASATHGGWISFSATGPKVDGLGLVAEDRQVCPYSLDMCEDGQKCYGTTSPVGNSSADPDHVDAIYMRETSSSVTCFRMARTQIQNLAYVNKTDSDITIEYVDGAATGAATVSVSGDAITITIDDEVTTTDTIVTAIEGSAANDMVKVINLKTSETQDVEAATDVAAMDNDNWEEFETYCNATPAALEPACDITGRDSCIGTSDPITLGLTPTKLDSRFWDEQSDTCYRSTGTTAATDWVAYEAPAEISISWNAFSVSGSSSIDEYRVYRRLANEEFDFTLPINKEEITASSSTYTFVDNNENSVTPPSPGTVYYYVVRPVISDILTSTAAESGTNATGVVRMMAPPQNMSFAHRWMINKTMCELMNLEPDETQNYRCDYTGAGDVTGTDGNQYYDFGKDLLVDRFEAGCPFSAAPNCSGTYDNSCIGVSPPADASISAAAAGVIYYDRTYGKCYISTASGVNWSEISGSSLVSTYNALETSEMQTKYNRSGLPPWTNISQFDSNSVCTGMPTITSSSVLGYGSDVTRRLPTRKDQVAYSQWDTEEYTNTQIATLETGLSLNSTSKCNSSEASGLDDGYVNIDKPDSNDYYTIPGTNASDIRSLATGSDESGDCKSIFGVQDAVGNVAEWTSHGFHCPLMSQCFSNENLVIQDIEYKRVRPASDNYEVIVTYDNTGSTPSSDVYISGTNFIIEIGDDILSDGSATAQDIIDLVNNDSDNASIVVASLIGSDVAQRSFGPAAYIGDISTGTDDTQFESTISDDYGIWSVDGLRGPCVDSDADDICDANITAWAYEDERYSGGRFMTPLGLVAHVSAKTVFDTLYDLFEIGPTSGITALQLHDDTFTVNSDIISSETTGCGGMATGGSYLSGTGAGLWNMEAIPCNDVYGSVTIQDVTYRAVTADGLDYTIIYDESNASVSYFEVNTSAQTITIDIGELNSAYGIVEAINAVSTDVKAFLSGNPETTQVAFSSEIDFNDLQEDGKSTRVDVGFRCVIDLDTSNYDE